MIYIYNNLYYKCYITYIKYSKVHNYLYMCYI